MMKTLHPCDWKTRGKAHKTLYKWYELRSLGYTFPRVELSFLKERGYRAARAISIFMDTGEVTRINDYEKCRRILRQRTKKANDRARAREHTAKGIRNRKRKRGTKDRVSDEVGRDELAGRRRNPEGRKALRRGSKRVRRTS